MGSAVARALVLALVGSVGLVACATSPEVVGAAKHPERTVRLDARPAARVGPPGGDPTLGSQANGDRVVITEPTGPYRGLGTWIDIYDDAAWEHPVHTVRSMAAHGVKTIYLQTSNYSRNGPFVYKHEVEAFLDAAHRHGLKVVAWYLPGFRDLALDLRRTVRAIRLTTDDGNRFDSFALDIESPEVRKPWVRTARLLRLSQRIRSIAGEGYPLGAIVASPHRLVRTDPRFWPSFPWRRLASTYDVFLPMTYYTYRVKGPRGAARYTAQNLVIIRQKTAGMNVPIHVVGGISFDATGAETRGFVNTVRERDVIGASYYTFTGITLDQWKALSALR